jgi:hypothetical protein
MLFDIEFARPIIFTLFIELSMEAVEEMRVCTAEFQTFCLPLVYFDARVFMAAPTRNVIS